MKYILILIIPFILGCGVTKTVTVPVETKREEYVSKKEESIQYITDSIFIKDSIYIKERGDTVFYYKTSVQEQVKYLDKFIHKIDTFLVHDSIEIPIPVTTTVEVNVLHWWQKALMFMGGVFLLLLIILFANKFK